MRSDRRRCRHTTCAHSLICSFARSLVRSLTTRRDDDSDRRAKSGPSQSPRRGRGRQVTSSEKTRFLLAGRAEQNPRLLRLSEKFISYISPVPNANISLSISSANVYRHFHCTVYSLKIRIKFIAVSHSIDNSVTRSIHAPISDTWRVSGRLL